MSDPNQIQHLNKQIKAWMAVFAILVVLTLVTAGLSRFDLSVGKRVVMALSIAAMQVILSASYMMHLNSERRGIRWVLILTGLLFVCLIFLPLFALVDRIRY